VASQEPVPFWISQEVLQWNALSGGGRLCDDRDTLLNRPYQLPRHAEDKLTPSASELDLVDSITTLKRAAHDRKDALTKEYNLKRIPISSLPNDQLERLAFFEIIRPIVLRTLVEIRNYIEHEGARPPELIRCKEIAEYVWYFLRSTDPLLRVIIDTYNLHSKDDEDYWIEVRTGPLHDWSIEVRGWLPQNLFSNRERHDWLALSGVVQLAKPRHGIGGEGRNSEDVYVTGRVLGPRGALVSIYRQYFSQV
jgi:hypothetical protein